MTRRHGQASLTTGPDQDRHSSHDHAPVAETPRNRHLKHSIITGQEQEELQTKKGWKARRAGTGRERIRSGQSSKKKRVVGLLQLPGIFLAGPTRLELATSGVTGRRSNQTELRSHNRGGRNRARTCDPRLVRPMLSQLSYSPPAMERLFSRIRGLRQDNSALWFKKNPFFNSSSHQGSSKILSFHRFAVGTSPGAVIQALRVP